MTALWLALSIIIEKTRVTMSNVSIKKSKVSKKSGWMEEEERQAMKVMGLFLIQLMTRDFSLLVFCAHTQNSQEEKDIPFQMDHVECIK
jgi:hypothetical protein